jgi:hypothetical protein
MRMFLREHALLIVTLMVMEIIQIPKISLPFSITIITLSFIAIGTYRYYRKQY